ncbi:MAG TPA: response regulator [Flavisolibacter sp.]|jgi:DNA-binding response OmpR family regulator
MEKRIVLVCDNDAEALQQVSEGLRQSGYEVKTVNDASTLISTAEKGGVSVVIANPEMTAFNENDICSKLIGEMGLPLILLLDRNSTHRAIVGDCQLEDTVTKPVDHDILANLVSKHIAMGAKGG